MLKIEWKRIDRSKLVVILFLAFSMAIVIARILADGIGVNDLLMAISAFFMAAVLSCMMWPKKARILVQEKRKAIYAIFLLLITPVFVILAIKMAANAVNNCCSEYAIWQALGAVGGIGAILILSTEIVPYGIIYIKIKKAVRY